MSKKTDRELIYQGYLDYYSSYAQKNKYSLSRAIQKWQLEKNRLNKLLALCECTYLMAEEKRKVIKDGKAIYQEYCRCLKSDEQSIGLMDQGRMLSLLSYIAEYEQEIVERYRYQLFSGERLDLSKILADKKFGNQIAQRPIDKILDQCFDETNNITCFKGEERVYITETGKKYHEAGCTYCKPGIHRKIVPYKLADNYGLEPCKCIVELRAKCELENRYVTVFIDESIRNNPWSKMEGIKNLSQGSYSYIICRGRLTSEADICQDITIDKYAGLLEETVGSTNAAIETINNVLMKLAFRHGFTKEVIIYTDNQSAAFTWEKNEQNQYLMSLFDNVRVIFIPRDENKVADKIGREVSFFDVPTSVMDRIVYKCKVYDEFALKIV